MARSLDIPKLSSTDLFFVIPLDFCNEMSTFREVNKFPQAEPTAQLIVDWPAREI
jgi:hypothetical protein